MTDAIPKRPLDEMLEHIAAGVDKWKSNNSPQQVEASVVRLLDKHRDQIVIKLLGFDGTYGGWKVDHCNGRGGDSAAGDYLRNAAQPAIQQWFEQVELPEMDASILNSIRTNYQKQYADHLRKELYKLAQERAAQDAKHLMDQIAECHSADAFLQLTELLSGKE